MDTPKPCPKCGQPLGANAVAGLCPECLLKAGLGSGSQAARAGFAPPPPADLQPHFPQLELLSLLGQGGMGAVYKARQPALDRLVALKILPAQSARDPGFAERFVREARALARLSHPNIVAVYDYGEAGGFLYFVMEFVDGANLRQIERVGKLAPREALQIIPQICDALQFAHNAGVVHRDIKPENILLDKQGRVKIADFGLAKLLGLERPEGAITAAYHALGTPHYMAPEQVERPLVVDHRADIYSLGVVFYEMLTGELPIGRFAAPSKRAAVDARLDDVVLRTLEKEPAERYQHASEVKTDVETIACGAPPAGAPKKPVPAVPPPAIAPSPLNWRGALRAVCWTFFAILAGAAAATMLYLVYRTPLYTSTASLQILRERSDLIAQNPGGGDTVASAEDFNTQVRLMESAAVANEVNERLKDLQRQELMKPYENFSPPPTVQEVLLRGRAVEPLRLSLMMQVSFTHPYPEIAAQVANLFADEFIASGQRRRAEELAKFIEDLQWRANDQRRDVERIQGKVNELVEKYGLASLQKEGGLVQGQIQDANAIILESKRVLDLRTLHKQMLEEQEAAGKPLWELSFIAQQPRVIPLLDRSGEIQAALATNSRKFDENHPDMMQYRQALATAEKQLAEVIASARQTVKTDYDYALRSYNQAVARQNEAAQRAIELSKVQVQYDTLQRDLKIKEAVYLQVLSAIEEKKNAFQLARPSFRIVDRAVIQDEPSNGLTFHWVLKGAALGAGGGAPLALLAGLVVLFRRPRVKAKRLQPPAA